ncbi:hypothetical protein GGE68_004314 [Rhizobium leguminosarum]|nr:hypothetical protein [Rhizobium leguminosarum]
MRKRPFPATFIAGMMPCHALSIVAANPARKELAVLTLFLRKPLFGNSFLLIFISLLNL